MESIWQDLRFAWRMMRRQPVVTAVALFSLVVGMSLSAVVFSLLDAAALRPLPVRDPNALMLVLEVRDSGFNHNFTYPGFVQFRAAQQSFTDVFAYEAVAASLEQSAGALMTSGELVSGAYFETLGVRMRFGRSLTDEDNRPGAPPAVVVSERFWRRLFGDTAEIGGRTVRLNGTTFAIVGVAADSFQGMEVGREARFWAPLTAQPVLDPSGGESYLVRPTVSWLTVMGRLRPDVAPAQALAEIDRAGAMLTQQRPNVQIHMTLKPGRLGDSSLPQTMAPPLILLLGAGLLVLTVACANVANLLLARAADRSREMAVRTVLGAGRGRIARLLLLEALLLGLSGASISLVIAAWTVHFAVPLISRFGEPVALDVGLDWRLTAFVIALGLATTLLAGFAPVLNAARFGRASALSDGGRAASTGPSSARIRRGLVVVQFALSLALVVAAALLVRTLHNLRQIDTGFDIDHVALLSADPEAAQYSAPRLRQYLDAAIERIASVAGVRAVGYGRVIPVGFGGSRATLQIAGYEPAPDEDMEINYNVVSPSYFDAMGITLVDGRQLDAHDVQGGPLAAIVNATMARRFWPKTRAVGREFTFNGSTGPPFQVVGVVRDVKYRELREEAGPSFYYPVAQLTRPRSGVLHVRTAADPATLLEPLRKALAEVDPAVPITSVLTLRRQADLNVSDDRLATAIGIVLGGAALLLAAIGLYGSMSYSVGQQRREIGVRIALGALPRDVRTLVLGQGLKLVLAGSAIGLGLAVVLAQIIQTRLYGVAPTDSPSFIASAALLALVALTASWVPARRASRVDPVEALRME